MRKGGSKNKGNKFENSLYDEIRSEGYWIRKNKGSGNAEDNKGDLEMTNLLIECKHHKSVSQKQVEEWMKKIYEEAVPLNKFPLLIVKENYKPIVVYYYSVDLKICKIPYSDWFKNQLTMEPKIKSGFKPIYIG